ncbi:hypothetical protein NMY22_g10362 [Coprinellus aureogranulatus]|nr:hypothetical protein NMY22_g10362 [Coprinellus aureogranulatus]
MGRTRPRQPAPAHPTEEEKGDKKLEITRAILFFFLGGLIAWVVQDMWAMSILNPSAIEKRRLGWDREYTKHQNQVTVMQEITTKWADEIQQHNVERQAIRAEREQLRKERAAWEAQVEERNRLDNEGKKLDLEKRRRELEREEEEEARKKAGLRWQDPLPDVHCLRYGTRKYTSRLENIPEGYSRLKACHETQAWINGRWSTPSQCDDQGSWGGVVGTWIVDYDEGACHTFFQDFKDKGCTAQGSGKRRIESHLENLPRDDDGMRMCSSTPAEFHGLHFDGAETCAYWGKYGYWGIWFIEDGSCR